MTKWWSLILLAGLLAGLLVACDGGTEEDTDHGGALVFVTSSGDFAELRRRAGALVAMYGTQQGPADAMGMMISAGAQASVEEVPNGARVVFVAPSPEKVSPLQNELRMHAAHLQPGSCKMAM